jgi:hypothetical protein
MDAEASKDLGMSIGATYRWQRARATYVVEGRVMIVDCSTCGRQMMPLTFGVLF